MITAIIVITLAFIWLTFETKCFTIRLTGKTLLNEVDTWTPYYKELLARDNKPRSTARTMAEWDIYNKQHAEEIEAERLEHEREYEQIKTYRESHECNICHKTFENAVVETKTFTYGNSTCHVKGCPDCVEKYRKDIEKSQTEKIRQPSVKNSQLPLFEYKHNQRIGSHAEWTRWNHETQELEYSDKYINGYSKRIVDEYETVYHNCLVSKEWLKAHENFEMPEPTIEITINDKTLPVNGNYRKGLIPGFMEQYTERVRAGKKTMTIVKGGYVQQIDKGLYVAVNGEIVNGEYRYF